METQEEEATSVRRSLQDADHTSTCQVQSAVLSSSPTRPSAFPSSMPPKRKAPPDQSQPTRRSTRARDQKDEGDVKTTDIAGPEKGVENEGKVELPPDVEYIPNVGKILRNLTR